MKAPPDAATVLVTERQEARRLFARLLPLMLTVVLSTWLLAAVDLGHSDYFEALLDKQHRLDSLPSPKLVIIGGSNAAFGINSDSIERATHLPVVNMAVHVGLGLPFMLNQVEARIGRGDIILLSPEYDLFYRGALGDQWRYRGIGVLPEPRAHAESLADFIRYLLRHAADRAQGTVITLLRSPFGGKPVDAVYARHSFDGRGDMQAHLGLARTFDTTGWDDRQRPPAELNEEALQRLATFVDRGRREGATVALIYPPLFDRAFHVDSTNIERVRTALTRLASDHGLVMLSEPSTSEFPLSDFYDSIYHLNAEGRAKRTEQILGDLTRARIIFGGHHPTQP